MRFALGALLALALCVGCGGGNGGAADAGLPDAFESVCPFPDGYSYVMSYFAFVPADQGFDLDGDEEIDNEIGKLPDSVMDSVNEAVSDSIVVGELMLVFHITDWGGPPNATDEDLRLYAYMGVDADVPPDPSNNYDGDAEFYVRSAEFDLDCESTTEANESSLVDRVLTARNDVWSFPITVGVGTLDLMDAILTWTFDEEFRTAPGMFGGLTTLCTLSQLPFPGETEGTVLDSFVNDPILKETISVDMDMDGDGFEEVVGDGVTILECIDGDGTTVIPGRDCPCHPAIVDAYSIAVSLEIVSARILGVVE